VTTSGVDPALFRQLLGRFATGVTVVTTLNGDQPKVAEARAVTEEFRRELSIEAPRIRRGPPQPGDELIRMFN